MRSAARTQRCGSVVDPAGKRPPDALDALHWAAARGNPIEVRRALRDGDHPINAGFIDKPSGPDWRAATALFSACSHGHSDCVQLLLAAHAAVDHPSNNGDTPLYTASGLGHSDCVQLLLASHAALDQPASNGATPLLTALLRRQDTVALVLIAARADVTAVLNDERGALHCAAFTGSSVPVCEALLAAGAACDARDAKGRTVRAPCFC